MPTELSSTEATRTPARAVAAPGPVAKARRAVADVGILVHFRAGTVRNRRAIPIAITVMVGVTLAACTIPMILPGAHHSIRSRDISLLLPTAFAAFLLLNVISGVASGGGRELLSREQGVAFPVSPTTDHLGALLMAPLNIAWLLQSWALLATVAYSLTPAYVVPAQVAIVLWLAACTSVAQVIAWTMEAIRRRKYGRIVTRGIVACFTAAGVAFQLSGHVGSYLDHIPTRWMVGKATNGMGLGWFIGVGFELAVILVAVVLGAIPTHLAAKLPPRDEARVESGHYAVRRSPRTVIGTLVSLDRASVWRSVPMRRGISVLGIGPGLVAIAGGMSWSSMTILPGLVASGGALLFGVNAWCLDGRGLLWRESLPARPDQVFAARALVLAEFVVAASLVTILLASLRAGLPSSYELTAMVMLVLVVTMQVVGAAMRWSAQRPFPVDMRSARATPAPPTVMVGYSTRLALSTTFTGLFFSVVARVPDWHLAVILAMPFLAWSGYRLWRTSKVWEDPLERARVVMTVAA